MQNSKENAKWFVRNFLCSGSLLTDKELEELKLIPDYQRFIADNPPKQHGVNYEVNIHTKLVADFICAVIDNNE